MSFKNNRGFSLIEIMMVAGLVGGLSLVIANMSQQTNKSAAKFDFDSEKTQITNEITGILSDPNKCADPLMLKGKNATNATNIYSISYTATSTPSTTINQYYSLASTTPAAPAKTTGVIKA
jgi:prepilin-type N-terminal cleavage/methylation domain-containing protein